MAKVKGNIKAEGTKKVTSIGRGNRSRVISKNKAATSHAKKYRGQGR